MQNSINGGVTYLYGMSGVYEPYISDVKKWTSEVMSLKTKRFRIKYPDFSVSQADIVILHVAYTRSAMEACVKIAILDNVDFLKSTYKSFIAKMYDNFLQKVKDKIEPVIEMTDEMVVVEARSLVPATSKIVEGILKSIGIVDNAVIQQLMTTYFHFLALEELLHDKSKKNTYYLREKYGEYCEKAYEKLSGNMNFSKLDAKQIMSKIAKSILSTMYRNDILMKEITQDQVNSLQQISNMV